MKFLFNMKHLSLFSGIGGFDLAAQWMGWENMAHCEINPFCRHILNYYWPKAISYEDIKTTDFSVWRSIIDIVTGGFPCQPFSQAGARKGTEDDRHLWPEMLRAIREIQPRYIVGENVYGIFNWSGGLVFEQVQIDLEAEGYEVQPVIIPACAIGAPHRRDRIWFIAYAKCRGFEQRQREYRLQQENIRKSESTGTLSQSCESGIITNSSDTGLQGGATKESYQERGRNENNDLTTCAAFNCQTGKTSQLNPRFVMEMMGFPPDWTLIPFLKDQSNEKPIHDGETNPLKPEETQ